MFLFLFPLLWEVVIEDLAVIYVREWSAYALPLRSFIFSGLAFRYLIHFEFIFVYGIRKCSSFILSHIVDQFSQPHLLKRLSFLHYIFLPPFKYKVSIGEWIYLWAFDFVPLIYISVFLPATYCLDDCSFIV